MKRDQAIHLLRGLDAETKKIRDKQGLSGVGEVIYQGDLYEVDNDKVVVTADGYGGASLSIVEGNHPVDYHTKYSRDFTDEQEACTVADNLLEGTVEVEDVFKD